MRGAAALPDLSRRLAWLALAALALAGCEAPAQARLPISAQAAARPMPELVETARFERVAETSGAAAQDLDAGRADLAARAEALRATAAGLAAPVIDPATRARLDAARETGIPFPGE